MRPTARALPATLRTTRLLLLGSSGEPHRPRAPLRAGCAALRQAAPPGHVPTATRRPRRRLREAATAKSRRRTARGLPDGTRCRTGAAALPEPPPPLLASAPFHGHAPGGRRTALSRGQRPLPPFPRGDRAWGAPARPRPPARRGREARRGSGGQGPGRDSRGRQREPSGRPTGRAAPPPLGRGDALGSSQWRRPPSARQGEGWGGNRAQRGAARRRRRGDPAAAQRAPTAGTRHPGQ